MRHFKHFIKFNVENGIKKQKGSNTMNTEINVF